MPWSWLGAGDWLVSVYRSLVEKPVALSAGLHVAGPGCVGRAGDCLDGGAALPGHRVHAADLAGRRGRTHDIYPFSIEPFRLLEIAWPNILGTQFAGNNYWGEIIHVPGARPKPWVPSLYLGGLTLVLALSSLTLRHGPPWRVWFTVIAVVSLLGSLGKYSSPIWVARVAAETTSSPVPQPLLPDLGPIDPVDDTPIRRDGYLRDGDGGFYWCLTHVLPGFRQFRFPAKLFTFTALALAVLAGVGWDRVTAGQASGARTTFALLLFGSLAGLTGVALSETRFSLCSRRSRAHR